MITNFWLFPEGLRVGKRGFHVLSRGRVEITGRIEVVWNDLLMPSVPLLFHWPSLVKAVLPDGSSARLLPGGPHTAHLWMCRNFVWHLISKVHFLNFFTLFVYLYEKKKRGKKKFLLDLEQAKPQNSVTNVHCWCSQHVPGLSSLRSIALGWAKALYEGNLDAEVSSLQAPLCVVAV